MSADGTGSPAGERDGLTVPGAGELAERARAVLDAHWREPGFCVPNATTYPWQWLWDSCFHAIAWGHLGDDRATLELASALEAQDLTGFVPHLNYRSDDVHRGFWRRPRTSSISQPPLYGHAAAELARLGYELPEELVARCRSGLRFLLEHRPRRHDGLVALCHPWESGADDSPRWDAWCPGGWDRRRWFEVKGQLVATVHPGGAGEPLANPAFQVGGAGFNALVSFNAIELGEGFGDTALRVAGEELASCLDARWDPDLLTWTDAGGPEDAGHDEASGRVRTVDALLGVLCTGDGERARAALAEVVDPAAMGGECGPAGVHRAEPAFDPDGYWRGAAWPQLTYLLAVAAGRLGLPVAESLGTALRRGADRSGFAEHWHPDTGAPGGAVPQSWSALAAVPVGAGS